MLCSALDTHTYDNTPLYHLIPHLPDVHLSDATLCDFLAFPQLSPTAKHFLRLIFQERNQPSNKIQFNTRKGTTSVDAEHLLACVYVLSKQHDDFPDLLSNLNEQLEDMQTGSCPQGRCNRLLQIIVAFPGFSSINKK